MNLWLARHVDTGRVISDSSKANLLIKISALINAPSHLDCPGGSDPNPRLEPPPTGEWLLARVDLGKIDKAKIISIIDEGGRFRQHGGRYYVENSRYYVENIMEERKYIFDKNATGKAVRAQRK